MVRREEEERLKQAAADSRCAFPTGGSPVPVGAGAPGSRPRAVAATKNAAGGKGPCGGQAGGGGTREGMVGGRRPNNPEGRKPIDKVRRLQRRLWAAAKQQPGRRFHALYDRIWRSDVLQEAWKRVKRNKGAAGVDAETIAAVEQDGVQRLPSGLQSVL